MQAKLQRCPSVSVQPHLRSWRPPVIKSSLPFLAFTLVSEARLRCITLIDEQATFSWPVHVSGGTAQPSTPDPAVTPFALVLAQARRTDPQAGDLRRLLALYEGWHRRVFPCTTFDGFLEDLEKLGATAACKVRF